MLRPTKKVGWLSNMLRPTKKVGWLPNKVVASNQKGRLAPRQGSTQQKLCFTFISVTLWSVGGPPFLVAVGSTRRFTHHPRGIRADLLSIMAHGDGRFTRHPRGIRAELLSIMALGDGLNGFSMRHQDEVGLFSSIGHHQMKSVRWGGPYQTISSHHDGIGIFMSDEFQIWASRRKCAATLIDQKKRNLHMRARINKRRGVGLFSGWDYQQIRWGWWTEPYQVVWRHCGEISISSQDHQLMGSGGVREHRFLALKVIQFISFKLLSTQGDSVYQFQWYFQTKENENGENNLTI